MRLLIIMNLLLGSFSLFAQANNDDAYIRLANYCFYLNQRYDPFLGQGAAITLCRSSSYLEKIGRHPESFRICMSSPSIHPKFHCSNEDLLVLLEDEVLYEAIIHCYQDREVEDKNLCADRRYIEDLDERLFSQQAYEAIE